MSLLVLTLSPTLLCAQAGESPAGVAWQVRGSWQVEGEGSPILNGDAVLSGSLLQPGEKPANDSIVILLPDGQRILYECFTAKDCARGFRVPSLYRKPEPFALEMLARIRAVLVRQNNDQSGESGIDPERLPRDEAVTVLDPGNRVQVGGLASHLPNGRYTYDLRPLDRARPRQFHLALEKSAPFLTLALPSSGLYALTIIDDLNTPRINLFLAAVRPTEAASFRKQFREAQSLLKEWNTDYAGWPIHDFQRAYLEALMLGTKPMSTVARAVEPVKDPPLGRAIAGRSAAEETHVTADPAFFPKPGVFPGDTAVTLRCHTHGAIMRYTVDGSQPTASSPVYRAPIMVKGTELTIKSFASAAGRKDSAVVTGIFRIQQ